MHSADFAPSESETPVMATADPLDQCYWNIRATHHLACDRSQNEIPDRTHSSGTHGDAIAVSFCGVADDAFGCLSENDLRCPWNPMRVQQLPYGPQDFFASRSACPGDHLHRTRVCNLPGHDGRLHIQQMDFGTLMITSVTHDVLHYLVDAW
jgi:hypothetical protein